MTLKQPKKKGVASKGKKGSAASGPAHRASEKDDPDYDSDGEMMIARTDDTPNPAIDPDDPNLTIPLTRYNAMLAVLRNTLYMYETARIMIDDLLLMHKAP
jgi:hypothetical protein